MLDAIQGYPLKFIQKASSGKNDAFDFCRIYCFYTESTSKCQRLKYIIRAEAHKDVFAIKFYAARDKYLDNKYNRVINTHTYRAVLRIFVTCASLIPILTKDYPDYSYIVNGAQTIDSLNKIENEAETQRFRIYRSLATKIIGEQYFGHYQFKEISSYLIIKKRCNSNIEEDKKRIKSMFLNLYDLDDIWQ